MIIVDDQMDYETCLVLDSYSIWYNYWSHMKMGRVNMYRTFLLAASSIYLKLIRKIIVSFSSRCLDWKFVLLFLFFLNDFLCYREFLNRKLDIVISYTGKISKLRKKSNDFIVCKRLSKKCALMKIMFVKGKG